MLIRRISFLIVLTLYLIGCRSTRIRTVIVPVKDTLWGVKTERIVDTFNIGPTIIIDSGRVYTRIVLDTITNRIYVESRCEGDTVYYQKIDTVMLNNNINAEVTMRTGEVEQKNIKLQKNLTIAVILAIAGGALAIVCGFLFIKSLF